MDLQSTHHLSFSKSLTALIEDPFVVTNFRVNLEKVSKRYILTAFLDYIQTTNPILTFRFDLQHWKKLLCWKIYGQNIFKIEIKRKDGQKRYYYIKVKEVEQFQTAYSPQIIALPERYLTHPSTVIRKFFQSKTV